MNLELTEEQDMIIGMVRKFVREEILPLELDLDPDADELERDDRERLIEKTKAMGLYGLDIPPEYGGPEIIPMTSLSLYILKIKSKAKLLELVII